MFLRSFETVVTGCISFTPHCVSSSWPAAVTQVTSDSYSA